MGKAVGGNALIEARLAAAQCLSDFDGHALAGFLDAEASFLISPNNGGRTWICQMSIALRRDDGDVLTDLCRSTGLGRVCLVRARRTSRPQAKWTIASKRECAELVRILRRHPLRARKRRDFDIWARAVDRWSAAAYDADGDPAFHGAMARDADLLRNVRRYVNTPPPALDGPDEALVAYLGGFFSGEGCFQLSRLQPRAVIKLRRDDRSILELFASRFEIGSVRDRPAYGNKNPSVTWLVCATGELARAICLFDAAQLRGRKRREFEVWRQAAYERASARVVGRRWDRGRVEGVAERLRALRPYRHPTDLVAPTRADAEQDARSAYANVLRAFADEAAGGPLTCTACARAREDHPEWPNRDTITLAFGGWAEALRGAGLGERLHARSSGTRLSGARPIADRISSMGRSTAELAPAPAPPDQPLSTDLCWLLSRASYTLTTELTAAFEGLGLSPRANCVLATAMTGPHTQSEIARAVGLDKTTMVVTLDELEAAGLAERRPSPNDRRARVIAVTAAGERKVREAEDIAERVRADVLSTLPDDEREVFLKALTRLVSDRLSEPVVCSHPVRRRAPRT
jgi:MarR family transcriptional regulator, transcriptional regulator for hemolysin